MKDRIIMQVKEVKSEGLSHELEVTVPAGEIKEHLQTRLQEVGKTVKMPGFRPGKVPMNILMERYGRAVMGEVLENAVNDATAKVLHEKKLRPAMQPKIEVKEFDEGKDLIYKMELDVLPNFEAMDVKGLKIEKPVAKITDKEIEEALGRITAHHKGSKKIEGDRASKKGDFVVMNFNGRTKDDGVEHDGMKAEGHKLELGSGQFIPGFEDQLVGHKAGAKIEVNVTFPENYGAKELAGREAIFDVEIKEIHEATDAVVNDDFAKELGFDDEKALRDAVKHQLESDYAGQTRLKMKRQLLDALDDGHEFDIPAGMLDAELEGITAQITQDRKNDPEAKDEGLSDEDKEELEIIAERRVRLGLVIAEIGQQNNITVNDQELQRAVISEAQKFPGQEKMIFEYYQKTSQALEQLRAPLFEDKVCDFIFEQADVAEKEVSVEELLKDDEDERLDAAKAKKKATKKSAKKPAAKKSAKKASKKSAKKAAKKPKK
ncbi:MAG: trigger factor [Alphaproteobacteria bacterium]|nr:trigger factor [Alphaproteobacteria bacterium]